MKKRILSLLLVVAMLATMVVVPAYAVAGVDAETYNNTPGDDEQCPCGCGLMKDAEWTDFNAVADKAETNSPAGDGIRYGSFNLTSNRHYYLSGDLSTSTADRLLRVNAAVTAVFDLNGHTIAQNGTGSSRRVFQLGVSGASLYIVDRAGGGKVVSKSTQSNMINTIAGGKLEIYGGTFEAQANVAGNGSIVNNVGTCNIYGGVFDASNYNQSTKNGGAIYSTTAITIKNAYIKGGQAAKAGTAVYANNSALTIDGCYIDGSVCNAGTNTTLKGVTTITELDMTKGGTYVNSIAGLKSGSSITVKAAADEPFSTAMNPDTVATYAGYFNSGVDGLTVQVNTDNKLVLAAPSVIEGVVCPHCGEEANWEPWTAAAGASISTGHYYLTDSQQINNYYTIASNAKVCLDMNGNDIGGTSNGKQLFWVNSGATLNICDLSDSGESELKAYGNCAGGVAFISGNMNVKGGTNGISLSSTAPTPGDGTPDNPGGLLRVGGNSSVVTVENCTLTGSNYAHTNGGVLHNGGSSAQFTFTNCTINGSAVSGNGGAINNGGASAKFTFTGCTLSGGDVDGNGGVIATDRGTFIFNGCTVNGGNATGYGGAIAYTNANGGGTLTITNTTVVDGTAASINGFSTAGIYHAGYAGGQITDSTIGTIYTVNNGAWITFIGTIKVDELILDNDTQSTQNAKINSASLNADSRIGLTTTGDSNGNYGKFSTSDENAAARVDCFTLNTDVEGLAVVVNGLDLCVDYKGFFAVDADGNETYCATIAEAQAMNPSYIKVAYQDEITVSGGETIDANGNDLTVKGTGAVTLIDAANQDYTTYGLVTLEGVTLANTETATVNGVTYYTIQDNDGKYSFHVLDSKLTSVGLKKSTGGLYYYATFKCDDLMAENVQYFGIKYELYDAEGANPFSDKILYGAVSGALRQANGDPGYNVEIALGSMDNIVNGLYNEKAGLETNEEMGQLKIKATPFACVDGELPAEGEPDLVNDVVAMGTERFESIYDICEHANELCANGANANLSAQMYQLLFVDWALNDWEDDFTNFAPAAA